MKSKELFSLISGSLMVAVAGGVVGLADGRGIPGGVAFSSMRDGNAEIYTMDADGGTQTRITTDLPADSSADTDPAISPNGQNIVFTSNRTMNRNNDIFVVGSQGGTPINLTANPASDGWARWSPDGQQIIFHSNRDGGDFEIYVMDFDGARVTRLTNYTGVDQFPDWSPTGKQIVFRRDNDIHVLDLPTGDITRLTAAAGVNQMAMFSPNGKHIVFMSTRDGYPSVFTMDADGANQVNRTPKPEEFDALLWMSRAPSWSENGREIYFTSFRPSTQGDTEIFVMNADGGDVRKLTESIGVDASARAR